MSDYDYSEFGAWDADSGSFHNIDDSPPRRFRRLPSVPLPPSSPPRLPLSPLGQNLPFPPYFLSSPPEIPLVVERIASPQGSPAHSLPVARTPTPELRYPSPAPLPLSPPSVRLVSPVPRPASSPVFRIPTPALHPLTPPPRPPTPDSPIDYEAAELRVAFYAEQRASPAPVEEDQENVPPAPAPVNRPPSCLQVRGEHPHQYPCRPHPSRRGVAANLGVPPVLHPHHSHS